MRMLNYIRDNILAIFLHTEPSKLLSLFNILGFHLDLSWVYHVIWL